MNWKKAFKGSLLITGLSFLFYYIPLLVYDIILNYLGGSSINFISFIPNHAYKYIVSIKVFDIPIFILFTLLFGFLLGVLKLIYDITFREIAEEIPKEKGKPEKEAPPPKIEKEEEEMPPPLPIEEFQSFQIDWSQ